MRHHSETRLGDAPRAEAPKPDSPRKDASPRRTRGQSTDKTSPQLSPRAVLAHKNAVTTKGGAERLETATQRLGTVHTRPVTMGPIKSRWRRSDRPQPSSSGGSSSSGGTAQPLRMRQHKRSVSLGDETDADPLDDALMAVRHQTPLDESMTAVPYASSGPFSFEFSYVVVVVVWKALSLIVLVSAELIHTSLGLISQLSPRADDHPEPGSAPTSPPAPPERAKSPIQPAAASPRSTSPRTQVLPAAPAPVVHAVELTFLDVAASADAFVRLFATQSRGVALLQEARTADEQSFFTVEYRQQPATIRRARGVLSVHAMSADNACALATKLERAAALYNLGRRVGGQQSVSEGDVYDLLRQMQHQLNVLHDAVLTKK